MRQELTNDLVESINRAVWFEASRLTHNRAEQEDAVQDGWVALLKALDDGRHPGDVVAYARRMARNCFVSRIRKEKRDMNAFASIAPEELYSERVECPVLRQSREDDMLSLPMRLSPKRRLAAILANYGKSMREIAQVMGASVGTAKATLHAGRQEMAPWAIELAAKYDNADEPCPEEWEPAMRMMTRADREEIVRQIEDKGGPMTAEERADIIEPKPFEHIPHKPARHGRRPRYISACRLTRQAPAKGDESRKPKAESGTSAHVDRLSEVQVFTAHLLRDRKYPSAGDPLAGIIRECVLPTQRGTPRT